MSSGIVYTAILVLSILSALGGLWCFVAMAIAAILGHKVDRSGLGMGAGFLVSAAVLYALCDIGARLMRVEEQLRRRRDETRPPAGGAPVS